MLKILTRPFVAFLFALFCFGAAPSLWAQQSQWAVKMFSETGGERVHDFGSVALHADVEHRFQFKNIYREDVVISSVASNCGCTKATATKTVIRSGEIGEIVARVDTSGRVHTKGRKATITVHFSKPTFAEVQLQVKTYIRSDVGFDPGSVDFGTVAQGKSVVKKAYLRYEGRSDWALVGIQKSNPGVRAEAREVLRQGGSVAYEILVELKKDAAPGYLHDLLRFQTNDPDRERASIFLPIDALVTAPLTAKPSNLQLGVVRKNETICKNLVVCGSTPFKIVGVGGDDPRMSFLKTDLSRTVHVVPVTFRAGDETGPIERSVYISTNRPNEPNLRVVVSGFVVDENVANERKMLDGDAPGANDENGWNDFDGLAESNADDSAAKTSRVRYVADASPILSTENDAPPTEPTAAPQNETPSESARPTSNGDGWKAPNGSKTPSRRRVAPFRRLALSTDSPNAVLVEPLPQGENRADFDADVAVSRLDSAPSPGDRRNVESVLSALSVSERVDSTPSVALTSALIPETQASETAETAPTPPSNEIAETAPATPFRIPKYVSRPIPIARDALPGTIPGSSASGKSRRKR